MSNDREEPEQQPEQERSEPAPYEAPSVEDLDSEYGPSVTAAGISVVAAPRSF